MGGKRFLFQSIDTRVRLAEDCTQRELGDRQRRGASATRACASSTSRTPRTRIRRHGPDGVRLAHALDHPRGDQAYIYVSSYPLGARFAPPGWTRPERRLSRVHDAAQEDLDHQGVRTGRAVQVRAQGTAAQRRHTAENRGFKACHDIQFFMPRKTADRLLRRRRAAVGHQRPVEPDDPTSRASTRTSTARPPPSSFEFIHSGVVSWDGKTFAIMDETGGGVEPHCFGAACDERLLLLLRHGCPGRRRACAARPLHDPAGARVRRSACRTTRP